MSRRPPTIPRQRLTRAVGRMAPGGRMMSESPIPRAAIRKIRAAGVESDLTFMRWADYPPTFKWSDHPPALTWSELETVEDLGVAPVSPTTPNGWPYIGDDDLPKSWPPVTADLAWKLDALDLSGGGGGVTDHGALTGLSDPDHPIAAVVGLQTALDGKAPTAHSHVLADLPAALATDAEVAAAVTAHEAQPDPHPQYLTVGEGGGGGVTDHGALTGLADDDHPQYLNAARVAAYTAPVLVLGPTDPVPGGTAAGTVIVRRAV